MSNEVPQIESRGNFDALIPWARRLLAEGKSTGEVMRAIYGVDLPAEVYAIDRAYARGLKLPLYQTYHPWELFTLADPSHEARRPAAWEREQEEHAYAQQPSFLPLLSLQAGDTTYDDHVLGYDLEELRKGNTVVVGHVGDIPVEGAKFEVLGTSLLDLMYDWMSEHLEMVTHQLKSPTNRGAGSLEQKDVDRVAGMLSEIEALRKEAAILQVARRASEHQR
jgi:hypothetical protein